MKHEEDVSNVWHVENIYISDTPWYLKIFYAGPRLKGERGTTVADIISLWETPHNLYLCIYIFVFVLVSVFVYLSQGIWELGKKGKRSRRNILVRDAAEEVLEKEL